MKRIVAYLLALSMFFSLILVTPVLADGSDYNNKNVEYAADVLSGLDIYRKSSSATNRITRMEFLTALCEIIDKGDIIPFEENNVKHITDVSGADLKYVDLALKKGIIKNPSDGKFNPNGNVDMDFASYALVAMIGYFQDVQNDTHIKRARAMGLTKDVRNSDALTYADVVLMLYNMLDSQFLEQVVYGNTSQFVESEITVLEHFFGLKKFDARLIANSCTDLSGAIELADGYIALQRTKDGIIETYKCNYKYNEALIGRSFTVYYDGKEDCIVYMIVKKNDTCLVEFVGSDFIEFDKNERKLYYNKVKNGSRWEQTYKKVYATLPQNVDIIYNGQFTQEHRFVFDILEGKSDLNIGKIEIYDYNGDSNADLLKVEAYQNIVVDAVNENGKTILDSLTGTRTVLDEDEIDGIVRIENSDGEAMNISGIKRNDIVSVYYGRGKKPLIRVVVCSTAKNEYLVSKYESDGKYYIESENSRYLVSSELLSSGKDISLGKDSKLHLDHLGCIVKVAETDTVYNYIGSVVSADSVGGAFSKQAEIKIYTANGKFVTYKTAKKMYLDDEEVIIKNNDDLRELVNNIKKEIIQFRVNSENEITHIYIPGNEKRDGILMFSKGMTDHSNAFKSREELNKNNEKRRKLLYKTNGKYFIPYSSSGGVNFVALSTEAKFLTVPSIEVTDEREKCYKISKSLKNDTKAIVVGYTFTEGSVKSDLVVIVNEGSVSFESSPNYVVKNIYYSLNSDGHYVQTIDCMNASGEISTFAGEDMKIRLCDYGGDEKGDSEELAVGDVVKVALNANGEIDAVVKMYDSVDEENSEDVQKEKDWYGDKRFVYGYVYDIEDNVISYVVGKDGNDDEEPKELHVAGLNSRKAIIVKTEGKKKVVEYGNLSEAVGKKEDKKYYSRVVLAGSYGETSFLVFYLND